MNEHKDNCCSSELAFFTEKEAVERLQYLDGWVILEDEGKRKLNKVYRMHSFHQCAEWLEKIVHIASQFNHHPVITIDWKQMGVTWQTASVGGLTDSDFACAEACDMSITDHSTV